MKIAFLVPDSGLPGGFWDVLVEVSRCAAERLGIELEVGWTSSRARSRSSRKAA